VTSAHATFVELDGRFLETITRWQIRPAPWDAMAPNDPALGLERGTGR
jgi:hypothetical protein